TNFPHEKDADPAYQKYRREEQIIDLGPDEIVAAVAAYPCRHYVFTGGEPLIQEKSWCVLMAALSAVAPESTFEIESNGTLLPGAEFLERIDQINLSPKLANSGVARELRYRPEVLRTIAAT